MKKLFFVYNPNAGKGLAKTEVPDILDIFVKAGYMPTVYPTQSYKDAYKAIRQLNENYDLIVCSGGDGTLDEVVTAMIRKNIRCPLGYIPAGSTNDFARSLKISRDMLDAAYTAVKGQEFKYDVGRFNSGIFVYIAAFGMFTDVSYATPQGVKNVLGHLAYVLEGVKRIYNIPSYKMTIQYDEEEPIKGTFIFGMVSNSKSVGGYKSISEKDTVFNDGKFEVMLIRKPITPIELQEVVAALLIEQFDSKYMQSFQASKITFECDEEIAWTLDGEFGGEHNKVEIINSKQEITLMVDKDSDNKWYDR